MPSRQHDWCSAADLDLDNQSNAEMPLPWNALADNAFYRVTVEYNHHTAAADNLNTWGNWRYFTVHPRP